MTEQQTFAEQVASQDHEVHLDPVAVLLPEQAKHYVESPVSRIGYEVRKPAYQAQAKVAAAAESAVEGSR